MLNCCVRWIMSQFEEKMLKIRIIKKKEVKGEAINVSYSAMKIGGLVKLILTDRVVEHYLFGSDIERVEGFSRISIISLYDFM